MQRVRILSAVLALCLLLALGGATLIDLLDEPGTAREERVARTPDWPTGPGELRAFLADSRFYIRNRYAFKDSFVALNGAIKTGLLGHAPTPEVLLGRDGFLFFADAGAIALVQGAPYPEPAEASAWDAHFARLSAAFEARDIPFLFVLAPNKHSVYADKLPAWVRAGRAGADLSHNETDRVLDIARAHLTPAPLDLRPVLAAGRAEAPDTLLYHRSDTHWNERGAALALRAALQTLGRDTGPMGDIEDVQAGQGGDLARMIGQQRRIDEWTPVVPRARQLHCATPTGEEVVLQTLDPLPVHQFGCTLPGAAPVRVLVFMDSYGIGAVPTLAQRFEQTEFVWQSHVDLDRVDEVRPDFVIQILVERKVQTINPESLVRGVEW